MEILKNKLRLLWALVAMWLLLLATPLEAAPGDLDPTFGTGGIVISTITSLGDSASSIQVQADGKIVVSGYSYGYDPWCGCDYVAGGFIARYTASGMPDRSFNSWGVVYTNYNVPDVAFGYAGLATKLQPDGKLITIGQKFTWDPQDPGHIVFPVEFAVLRYNANGTPDTSFGDGGKVFTAVDENYADPRDLVIQPDGKIVVSGFIFVNGVGAKFGTVRYNPDGSLDNSFGVGGKVITPIAGNFGPDCDINSLVLQPDGKIILVGDYREDIMMVRYNGDGSQDTSFGTAGNGKAIYVTPNFDLGFDSVLQPDGKIIVSGYSDGGSEIVRFDPNGSVDTSFADQGVFRTEIGFFVGSGVALQSDGKIVGFGNAALTADENSKAPLRISHHLTGNPHRDHYNFASRRTFRAADARGFAVARLNPDGSSDQSFGVAGRTITPVGTIGSSFGYTAELQPDGRILGAGKTDYGDGSGNAAIVRYTNDPATSRTTKYDFDGDGRADVSVFRPSDGYWYVSGSSHGFLATPFGLPTDKITPADYDGDGETDISVYRDGTWYWLNSSDGSFNAFQFGLSGDIPVPADYTGDGHAELAVYRGGTWYTFDIRNEQFNTIQFGLGTDKPVVGDYDGDGLSDPAVYRDGTWYMLQSSQGFTATQFGLPTDKLVPADYDGDGKTDPAVYRDGTWYLLGSRNGFSAFQFGISTDIPVPADYDGDGKADAAIYRDGGWYLLQSTNGASFQPFGLMTDKPIPAAYLTTGE